jgi:hypothetical protein
MMVLFAVIAMTGCAHSEPWTKQDTVLQSIYTALVIIDAGQTADIQYYPNYKEGNPIAQHVLGDQPSTSSTYQWMATMAISHYFISRALPQRWRPYWQGFAIFGHGRAIMNNCAAGIGTICHED